MFQWTNVESAFGGCSLKTSRRYSLQIGNIPKAQANSTFSGRWLTAESISGFVPCGFCLEVNAELAFLGPKRKPTLLYSHVTMADDFSFFSRALYFI